MITSNLRDFFEASTFPSRIWHIHLYNDKLLLRKIGVLVVVLVIVVELGSLAFLLSKRFDTFKADIMFAVKGSVFLTSLFFSLGYVYQHRKVSSLYLELLRTDRALRNESQPGRYNILKTVRFDVICFTVMFVQMVGMFPSYSKPKKSIALCIAHNLPYLQAHVSEAPLRSLLVAVDMQFSRLLEALRLKKSITPYGRKKLEYICTLHTIICDLSSRLNNLFSYHFVGLPFITFGLTVLSMFLIVELNTVEAYSLSSWMLFSLNLSNALFLCLWAIEICYDVEVCTSISEKSREFNYSLHELLVNDETGLIYDSIKIMNHLRKSNSVVFNACGLFKFNYEMLHTILASCTTYFIILIQLMFLSKPPRNLHEIESEFME